MIVLIIDDLGIRIDEAESDAPVAVYTHRPMTFEVAAKGMQEVTRDIQLAWPLRLMEPSELVSKPGCVRRIDSGL